MNPESFLAVDLGLRGGAVVLLLFLAATLLRDYRSSTSARLGAAFAAGAAAFAANSFAGFEAPAAGWRAPIIALASANPIVFWLFARKLFDDNFELRAWHALLWAGFAALSLLDCFAMASGQARAPFALPLLLRVSSLGFALLALTQTIRFWTVDLIEVRRRLRILIVGGASLYAIVDVGSLLILGQTRWSGWASVASAASLLLLTILIGWQLTASAAAQLFAAGSPTGPEETRPAGESGEGVVVGIFSASEQALAAKLEQLMAVGRVYREPSLTIGALADRLGVHEYQLRRLVNQGLGWRNFNAFLNDYRLREIKLVLRDSERAEVPLLRLAMEAGFQSLGPFNRAFKADTGMTPSEFRQRERGAHVTTKRVPGATSEAR